MEEKKEQELVSEQQINQQLENTLLGNGSQQQNLYEQNVLEQSTNEQYNVYEQNMVEENVVGSQNIITNQEDLPIMTTSMGVNNNLEQDADTVIPSVTVEEIPLEPIKTKEKKKSKLWIIILIIVFLLGIILFFGLRGDPNEITVSFSSEYSKMQLGENIQLSPIIE